MIKNKFNILPIILLILTLSIVAFAGSPLPDYKPQFFDANGNPLTSGSLKLCNPGTTNVKTIYTNSGLTVPKANPVNLDSSGRAEVWLNGTYDVYLYDGQNATGNLIYTLYNISSISAAATTFTPNYIDASEYGDLTATITTLGITTPYEVWVTDQQTLTDDTTIPANITLRVIRGGIIVADGYNLTFTGPLEANPAQQIFTGFTAGTSGVSFTKSATAYPEWWGADRFGTEDSYDDFVLAVSSMTSGGIIYGNPSATYLWSSAPATGLTITTSNLTLDGCGALIQGVAGASSKRFIYINGDSGTDGDWSSSVENTHIRNWRIGSANDSDNNVLIAVARWTKDCSLENIVKKGFTNTAVTIQVSKNFVCRNVKTYGSSTSNGSIGFLVHLSDDTLIDHCYVGDGAFVYAYQIKGGRNNVVRDSVAKNIAAAGSITPEVGFRDRGDAPWDASSTSGISYPWDTLSFSVADPRRATVNTRYINCSVEDSAVAAYIAQEGWGTIWENCSYYNAQSGWTLARGSDADSDEHDYTIINPTADTTTSGRGFDVNGNAAYHLPNVKIIGGTVRSSHLDGFKCTYTDDLLIDGLVSINNGLSDDDTFYGIAATTSSLRPKIVNCNAYDDQVSATQDYGVFIGSTCIDPVVTNCRGSGNITRNIYLPVPGFYDHNYPSDASLQTANGDATTLSAITLASGDSGWLEALVLAETTSGLDRARYSIGVMYYNTGSGAAIEDTVVVIQTPIETDPTWNATFTTASNELRVRVTGSTEKVNWNTYLRFMPFKEPD